MRPCLLRISLGIVATAILVAGGIGCGSDERAAAPPPLDEVLALMKDKGASHTTVEARVSHWSDSELLEVALRRLPGEATGQDSIVVSLHASSSQLWLERPNRCRSEVAGQTAVADGRNTWMEISGTRNVIRAPQTQPLIFCGAEMLADPLTVVEELALSVEGTDTANGRPVVVLRGDPKPSDDPLGAGGPGLGDWHRILIDLETGLLVGTESYLDGKPLERTTVEELTVGRAIPDERFTYTPKPNARVLGEEDLEFVELTASDAAARASFTIWAPVGFSGMVSLSPDLHTDSEMLTFSLEGREFPASVQESRATQLDGEGRRIVRQGVEMLVSGGDSADSHQSGSTVAFVRDGTRIVISSLAPVEELIDIALSFQPLPKP